MDYYIFTLFKHSNKTAKLTSEVFFIHIFFYLFTSLFFFFLPKYVARFGSHYHLYFKKKKKNLLFSLVRCLSTSKIKSIKPRIFQSFLFFFFVFCFFGLLHITLTTLYQKVNPPPDPPLRKEPFF